MVCVASVAVTLVIMIALGIRAFIECPKQISELAQRLIMTNSDFTKALTECYEESSELKQQLLNATFNLLTAINELKNMRNSIEENAKLVVLLKEKLDLIQHVNLTKNCTDLLEKAAQGLKDLYNSYVNNLRLREVADNCTDWFKLLEEEYQDLQLISLTINISYTNKLIKESQQKINNQNLGFCAQNYSTLRTKIQDLRDFVNNCNRDPREKNNRLKTINHCCTKDQEEENMRVQNVISSYANMSSEVNQLGKMKTAIRAYLPLNEENQNLKKQVEYHTNIQSRLRNCTENDRVLRTMAKFVSAWDYCDNQTLKCSQCLANWVRHSSMCYFLSTDRKQWMQARSECLRLGGDLAIAPSDSVQEFLTRLVKNASVSERASAWIGVSDLVDEAIYYWVNGSRVKDKYWGEQPSNEEDDCIAIVAPVEITGLDWINSWNVLNCLDFRQYICETTALTEPTDADEHV